MSNATPPLFLTMGQLRRLSVQLSPSPGVPRLDGRRVLGGGISVKRHGLRGRDWSAA